MSRNSSIETAADICTDTGTQDVAMKPGNSRVLRCIQKMSMNTGSTKATLVSFGLKRGNSIIWLGSQVQAANTQIASIDGPVYAGADYAPMARVTGGTSGQLLSLVVFGYTSDIGI